MNTKGLAVVVAIMVIVSLAAVNAFALPQYYAWGMQNNSSVMGGMSGGKACNMMNSGTMMGNMMNGKSMNAQQCQQHMASGGSQMMNGQGQQQCQQMGTNHNMAAEQCQAMH